MTITESDGSVVWAHIGDLHITDERAANYQDFESIVATSVSTLRAKSIFVCCQEITPMTEWRSNTA